MGVRGSDHREYGASIIRQARLRRTKLRRADGFSDCGDSLGARSLLQALLEPSRGSFFVEVLRPPLPVHVRAWANSSMTNPGIPNPLGPSDDTSRNPKSREGDGGTSTQSLPFVLSAGNE